MANKVIKFIQSSDYATLANDAGPVTVSVTVPNGSSATVSNTVVLGEAGAPLVYTISDSVSGFEWAATYFSFIDSAGQTCDVRVSRASATEAVIVATPFGAMTGTVTFTARIRSFIPPVV